MNAAFESGLRNQTEGKCGGNVTTHDTETHSARRPHGEFPLDALIETETERQAETGRQNVSWLAQGESMCLCMCTCVCVCVRVCVCGY